MYSSCTHYTFRRVLVLVHPPHSRWLSRSTPLKIPSGKASNETPSNDLFVSAPLVDQHCIPITPTWSVHQLINSYPSPKLSDASLTRLYELAALIPPEAGTSKFTKIKLEMEDLVRLIEAVRIAPLSNSASSTDEAIYVEGEPVTTLDSHVHAFGWNIGVEEDDQQLPVANLQIMESSSMLPPSGRELLKHAKRSRDGYYVVDSSRSRA